MKKNLSKTLLKFRALNSYTDYERIQEMIVNGAFWFSSLWHQNDALEGVYVDTKTSWNAFESKNHYRICSFSKPGALYEPLMWAHYAGGFKGVALSVTLDSNDSEVENYDVEYDDDFIAPAESESNHQVVKKIITHKSLRWKYEEESRLLIASDKERNFKVGKVQAIYFFRPYNNVENINDVIRNSNNIKEYEEYRKNLSEYCKKEHQGVERYDCFIKFTNGKTEIVEERIND